MKALLFNIQKFSLHDGNGIRTTVFFKGCNLRCHWCANPESLSLQQEQCEGEDIGRKYSVEDLMAELRKDKPFFDKSGGGVTLSGGDPLLQAEFVVALCDALHAENINIGIETAANVPTEIFTRVLGKCDFAYIDLKHWDGEQHKLGTGVGNRQILTNISQAMKMGLPVTVRIPLIPGYNNTSADALSFAAVLNELSARDVHILPFHQMGENKYKKYGLDYAYVDVPPLHEEDACAFAEILKSQGLCVQIGG